MLSNCSCYLPDLTQRNHKLLNGEGAILRCNIVIEEHENGEVEVSATNPLLTIDKTDSTPQIAEMAREVSKRLKDAVDRLHAMGNEPSSLSAQLGPSRPHGGVSRNRVNARWKNNIPG